MKTDRSMGAPAARFVDVTLRSGCLMIRRRPLSSLSVDLGPRTVSLGHPPPWFSLDFPPNSLYLIRNIKKLLTTYINTNRGDVFTHGQRRCRKNGKRRNNRRKSGQTHVSRGGSNARTCRIF